VLSGFFYGRMAMWGRIAMLWGRMAMRPYLGGWLSARIGVYEFIDLVFEFVEYEGLFFFAEAEEVVDLFVFACSGYA
jgi:hypothetical protein